MSLPLFVVQCITCRTSLWTAQLSCNDPLQVHSSDLPVLSSTAELKQELDQNPHQINLQFHNKPSILELVQSPWEATSAPFRPCTLNWSMCRSKKLTSYILWNKQGTLSSVWKASSAAPKLTPTFLASPIISKYCSQFSQLRLCDNQRSLLSLQHSVTSFCAQEDWSSKSSSSSGKALHVAVFTSGSTGKVVTTNSGADIHLLPSVGNKIPKLSLVSIKQFSVVNIHIF